MLSIYTYMLIRLYESSVENLVPKLVMQRIFKCESGSVPSFSFPPVTVINSQVRLNGETGSTLCVSYMALSHLLA